jgi:PilZ domain-containing protein
MTFKFSSPQAIRSASQRALASRWDELAAGRRFPELSELEGIEDRLEPKELVVWNVEGEGRLMKFRALYQGENVVQVFNADWAGMTMESVVPMSLRKVALDAAKQCVASGCLVYTIMSTIDASDQRVDCERLLLPFGRGAKVEHLISSLQLTADQSRPRILKHFEIQTDAVLEIKIKSGFTASARAAVAGGKVAGKGGELRRAARRDIKRTARISFARRNMTCTVRNLSATGAAIDTTNLAAIPDDFGLVLEMESAERRCHVVWRRKNKIGIQFS